MQEYYIGLMSGTSADGVDGVLVSFSQEESAQENIIPQFHKHAYIQFSHELHNKLILLNQPSLNDLEQSMQIAIECVDIYSQVVTTLLTEAKLPPATICAMGVHGQTVRHRPEKGYSIQINHPSLLAEKTGITTIADFRQRDIAAGGQGAPLVPSFHAYLWQHSTRPRCIINLGGISNVTFLPAKTSHLPIVGFDCGPANALMDAWIQAHFNQKTYDHNGQWAASGTVLPALLDALLQHPFFAKPFPKSTGRDIFHLEWVRSFLIGTERPQDVQATLLALTVETIRQGLTQILDNAQPLEIYLCGGGAYNPILLQALQQACPFATVQTTAVLGLPPEHIEAYAFAWLARQTQHGCTATLPSVTGARGPRILGAIYPA